MKNLDQLIESLSELLTSANSKTDKLTAVRTSILRGRKAVLQMLGHLDDDGLCRLASYAAATAMRTYVKEKDTMSDEERYKMLANTSLLVLIDIVKEERAAKAASVPSIFDAVPTDTVSKTQWQNERPKAEGLYLRSNPPLQEIVMFGILEIGNELMWTDHEGELKPISELSPKSWWFGPIAQPPWKDGQ